MHDTYSISHFAQKSKCKFKIYAIMSVCCWFEDIEKSGAASPWRETLLNLFSISETSDTRLRALNFAGAQASGANVYMTGRTLHNSLYTLYVRLPCSVGASVWVRHLNTEWNTLAAKFTFCHNWLHLLKQTNRFYYNRFRLRMQVFFSFFSKKFFVTVFPTIFSWNFMWYAV